MNIFPKSFNSLSIYTGIHEYRYTAPLRFPSNTCDVTASLPESLPLAEEELSKQASLLEHLRQRLTQSECERGERAERGEKGERAERGERSEKGERGERGASARDRLSERRSEQRGHTSNVQEELADEIWTVQRVVTALKRKVRYLFAIRCPGFTIACPPHWGIHMGVMGLDS